jgi:hypothetical protein
MQTGYHLIAAIRQSRLGRGRLTSILKLSVFILIALNFLIGEKLYASMTPPSRLHLTIDTTSKGSATLTIKFNIYIGFKAGILTYQLSNEEGTIVEKAALWEGKSDTAFNKELTRSINLPVGSKLKASVHLKYTTLVDGTNYENLNNLFIHKTSRWTTHDVSSFSNLDVVEMVREGKEKGIDVPNLSIKEIEARDPELARRLVGRPANQKRLEKADSNAQGGVK